MAGISAHTEKVTGSKVVRAEPFQAQLSAGNVKLVRGVWNAEYISELTDFTVDDTHKEDGQVDGSSGAFNHMALPKNTGKQTTRHKVTPRNFQRVGGRPRS